MKALRVVYEPDEDGWWTAVIPDLKGVLTDGRTLEEARRKIREALASASDLGWDEKRAAAVELIDDVRLPREVAAMMDARIKGLRALEDAAKKVEDLTRQLVRQLSKDGRSLRDIADLLGLSHARVHQILGDSGGAKARPADRRAAATRFVVAEAAARYRTRRRR